MDAKRGFVTQTGTDYREAFAWADEVGLDFVELMMDGANERTRLDPGAVRERADAYGLDLLVHLPFRLDITSPFEHVREGSLRELEAAIETAAAAGARKGVIHATTEAWMAAWDADDLRDHFFESVRRLDAHAREHDFELVVENLKGDFFSASDFPELFAATDARMTLDTGHAYATGLSAADQAALLREYPDRISHVHLNDTRQSDDDEHLPLGAGFVEFERLFEAMAAVDWSGTLSLEVFSMDWEYQAVSVDRLDALLETV